MFFKFYIIFIVKFKLLVLGILINLVIIYVEVSVRCYLDDRSEFLIFFVLNYN